MIVSTEAASWMWTMLSYPRLNDLQHSWVTPAEHVTTSLLSGYRIRYQHQSCADHQQTGPCCTYVPTLSQQWIPPARRWAHRTLSMSSQSREEMIWSPVNAHWSVHSIFPVFWLLHEPSADTCSITQMVLHLLGGEKTSFTQVWVLRRVLS